MFEQLQTAKKIVGLKQLKRAVRDNCAAMVFMADDADPWMQEEIEALCKQAGLTPIHIPTMKALGAACGIAVGAATAAVLKESNG